MPPSKPPLNDKLIQALRLAIGIEWTRLSVNRHLPELYWPLLKSIASNTYLDALKENWQPDEAVLRFRRSFVTIWEENVDIARSAALLTQANFDDTSENKEARAVFQRRVATIILKIRETKILEWEPFDIDVANFPPRLLNAGENIEVLQFIADEYRKTNLPDRGSSDQSP